MTLPALHLAKEKDWPSSAPCSRALNFLVVGLVHAFQQGEQGDAPDVLVRIRDDPLDFVKFVESECRPISLARILAEGI